MNISVAEHPNVIAQNLAKPGLQEVSTVGEKKAVLQEEASAPSQSVETFSAVTFDESGQVSDGQVGQNLNVSA